MFPFCSVYTPWPCFFPATNSPTYLSPSFECWNSPLERKKPCTTSFLFLLALHLSLAPHKSLPTILFLQFVLGLLFLRSQCVEIVLFRVSSPHLPFVPSSLIKRKGCYLQDKICQLVHLFFFQVFFVFQGQC